LASSSELRRATEQLKQMRQVLNTATTIPEHEQRLTALEGPRLDAADRSLPLPLLLLLASSTSSRPQQRPRLQK
jgi:hypothetical protein